MTDLPLSRLIKDFAIYGAGDLLGKASVFLTMPIYTRIFAPDEYGILTFVTTGVGLLAICLGLGGDSAYTRYYFVARTLPEKQEVTSTWVIFLSLWVLGAVLLCLPLAGPMSEWSFDTDRHRWLFALALLGIPVTLINSICGQVLRNQFRAKQFVVLSVATALLTIALSLFAVLALGLGLKGVLGGALAAVLVMLPIRLWTARGMLRPRFSPAMLWKLLSYGTPLMAAGLAYWVFTVSDRLMLGKLATMDELGLYSVAATLAGVLVLALGAFGQAWEPHAFKVYEETPHLAPPFISLLATYVLVGFGTLSVGIVTFAPELLRVLAAPAFAPAAAAIAPLALGLVAYATSPITAAGISITKKTGYLALFAWLTALLNVSLNLVLIPRWGMIGAAWATTVSFGFLTLSYLVTSQRLWPVAYESRRALTVIGATAAFTLLAPLLPELPLHIGVFVKAVYVGLFVGVLFVLGALDSREVAAIRSLLAARRGAKLTGRRA